MQNSIYEDASSIARNICFQPNACKNIYWKRHLATTSVKLQRGITEQVQEMLKYFQRGREFYESMWWITQNIITGLYNKYFKNHSETYVFFGSFYTLKAFQAHGITTQDVRVFCCKLQLPADGQ